MLTNLEQVTGRLSAAATRLNVDWARDHLDPDVVDSILDRTARHLGRDPRRALRGRWFPYPAHLVLLDHVAEHVDEADLLAMGAYGAENLHRVIPGARMALRVLGPRRLLEKAHWIWGTYADFGDVEVHRADDRSGAISLGGYRPSDAFCTTLQGFLQGLLQSVGAEDAHVEHTACMEHGARRCRFEGSWM